MDAAIIAEGVRKRYGDLWAVDDISLDVAEGECFAILGPNGAGKTTFTEILEGYRERDAGHVQVLGVDPKHGDRAWKSQLGIVLQSDRDLGDLTVREAVHHFAGYYPHSRVADEVIEAVGLAGKSKARNEKLSGGQRRRLDVALGIIGRPRLLFLDEPTTGFDPEARRDFWTLIDQLKADGTTILLTTHYLEEAERLADRVAIISAGRLLACDIPERIGGDLRHSARVSWLEDGVRVECQTMQPTQTVLDLAARFGGDVPGLEITRATLQDAYLAMVAGEGEEAEVLVP